MFYFKWIGKAEFDRDEAELFAILYRNMSGLVPWEKSFEEEHAAWYAAVNEGLQKSNRRIVKIEDEKRNLIGFFQYYIGEKVWMMEEIQFAPEWQGKGNLFRELYRFVAAEIPERIRFVEAYADKRNRKSDGILKRMGLQILEDAGKWYRYRGEYADFRKWLEQEEFGQKREDSAYT